jgi:hypothetical protein
MAGRGQQIRRSFGNPPFQIQFRRHEFMIAARAVTEFHDIQEKLLERLGL